MNNERSEVRPAFNEGRHALNNRLATVELLEKLLTMGYSESEAKAYIKTGDIDQLRRRYVQADTMAGAQLIPLDGTETR